MKIATGFAVIALLASQAAATNLDRYTPPPKLDLDHYSSAAGAPRPEFFLAQNNPANPLPPDAPAAPAPTAPAAPSLCSVAGPCGSLGKGWALGLSLDPWQAYFWGGRDVYNGKFAAAYGYELADFYHNGRNMAYLSGMNVFNSVEDSRGAIGGSIGIRPINTINEIASLVQQTPEDLITLPPWLENISDWGSIDVGYAYKMQATLPGESRNEILLGGKLQHRFDLTAHH